MVPLHFCPGSASAVSALSGSNQAIGPRLRFSRGLRFHQSLRVGRCQISNAYDFCGFSVGCERSRSVPAQASLRLVSYR